MNSKYSHDMVFYPLTHPQKRIWYVEKIYPGSSLYNIGGSIRIKGNVDFDILQKAINIFIKRNEGLRLQFMEQGTDIKQYIRLYEKIVLDFKDFSHCEEPENEFDSWILEEAKKPFKLDNERLFYFALFKISDTYNGYFAKFHHIICDGWSVNIMTQQICNNYIELIEGKEVEDIDEFSYTQYIKNEEKYLSSDRFTKNKLFWNEKFKVLPPMFLNKSSDVIEGKRKTYEIDSILSAKIKEFAQKNRFSLNTCFVTLFILYINKTFGQDDIVIGTPVLNRSGKTEKSMFGMFTSTMPFRFLLDESINVTETMAKVNKELMECYFNQKYPYEILLKDLELKKNGYDNLFNFCVNYYNTKLNSEINGVPIDNCEFYNGNQIYSMQLVIKDWSREEKLTLDFDYKVKDFSSKDIDTIFVHLTNLMYKIISSPLEKIENISLLSEEEKKQLLVEFNDTKAEYPKEKTICELFEDQVEKTPDRIAISFYKKELTYKELNEKSNQLARFLNKKGVVKGTVVSLLTTHSIETVIGILGVLKAGGAYLPIDPSYPNERITYMINDSSSKILLSNFEIPYGINFNGEIINLNDECLYTEESINLKPVNKPDDLVYIIYTSGSTGTPKGTMIEHGGLVNYIWWAKKKYIKDDIEVFSLYSSLAFDLTVTSIFTPLISGSKIIVYSNNVEESHVMYRIIKDNNTTVVKLTPSHLSLIKDMDNRKSKIKRFIVGGEDLKVSLCKDIHESFGGNIEIYNEYGPTETVVGCMIHKYDYQTDINISVPIGIPADNVQIYILDKKLLPVPINTVGEIYISGDGVSKGYLNRQALTAEKFIPNPFINGKIMYKTGDLAKFIDKNKITYEGRSDQQVKIRGYRIELDEIEKHLLNHQCIKDAVVIDVESEKTKYLCAYIVKKKEILTNELKNFLLLHLPHYMVPLYFIELDKIPLTLNGKVNRELLPRPCLEVFDKTKSITYKSENEEKIVKAICEVLNITDLDVRQNFYQLGGDSIKAIQIASKMNEQGLKIKVKDILSYPVIEEMAVCVQPIRDEKIIQEPCKGSIRATPIVSWFFAQKFSNPDYYNQSILLELNGELEIQTLNIILNKLIDHHDSLRINYDYETGMLFYNNAHLENFYTIEEYDFKDLPLEDQINKMNQKAFEIKSSFNIGNSILIKACVFNLGKEGKRLLITAHHLVVDGVSLRIITEDINTMLKQIQNGQFIDLPPKTHCYQKWSDALEGYMEKELEKEKKYWDFVLRKGSTFSPEHNFGEDKLVNCNTIFGKLSNEETLNLVLRSGTAYKTEPKELLVTALFRTIKEFTGNEEIVVELEGHGREDVFDGLDINRTVGWFTSIFPFYARIKGNELASQIKAVKEEMRKIPNNGIGFGLIKYLDKNINYTEERYIRFNYLGEFPADRYGNYATLLSEQLSSDSSMENCLTCLLDINSFIYNGDLNIFITYSLNKFTENTINNFAQSYLNNLKEITNHCCYKESVEFTPSDFDTTDLSQEELDSLFS